MCILVTSSGGNIEHISWIHVLIHLYLKKKLKIKSPWEPIVTRRQSNGFFHNCIYKFLSIQPLIVVHLSSSKKKQTYSWEVILTLRGTWVSFILLKGSQSCKVITQYVKDYVNVIHSTFKMYRWSLSDPTVTSAGLLTATVPPWLKRVKTGSTETQLTQRQQGTASLYLFYR